MFSARLRHPASTPVRTVFAFVGEVRCRPLQSPCCAIRAGNMGERQANKSLRADLFAWLRVLRFRVY